MEEWKEIKGYEGLYWVSNLGRVKSKYRILKSWNKQGKKKYYNPDNDYRVVKLSYKNKRKPYRVHRLVAKTFIPNPDHKSEINHKNGIKNDNRVENLEWVTRKENMKHYFKMKKENENE